MSYDAKERVIGFVDKGRDEAFRVAVVEGKDDMYSVDVRTYYDMDSDPKPTKKGIRVNCECICDVIVEMCKALDSQELDELLDRLTDMYNEDDKEEEQ